jgi:hypothetical protein
MLYDAYIEGERIQRSIIQETVEDALAKRQAKVEAKSKAEGKVGLLLRLAKRRFGDLPSDLPQQLGV